MSNSRSAGAVWRSIWWWLSTILLMGFIGLISTMSVVFSPVGYAAGQKETSRGMDVLLSMFSLLVVLAFVAMLWSRRRWPFAFTLAGAIAGVVLPIGPFFALVGFTELVASGRGKKRMAGTIAAVAVTLWSVIGDAYASLRAGSFIQSMMVSGDDAPEHVAVPFLVVVFLILLLLAIPVGIGLVMRFRSSAHSAVRERDRLGDELGRSQERERIAHEIHDVLGHRLSQLSLRASALETKAAQYPEIYEEAMQMRQSAAQSMDDLRSLLKVIHGESSDVQLADLEEIVNNTLADNQSVALSIFLNDAEKASGELSRAVVRIVQEIITNARKHAPGRPLRLSVAGRPGEGIMISAVNEFVVGGVAANLGGRVGHGAPWHGTPAFGTSGFGTSASGVPGPGIPGPRASGPGISGLGTLAPSTAGPGTLGRGTSTSTSASASTGTGRGLSGMRERVRLLGGQFNAGHLGHEFRVDAHIPWPAGR